MGAVPPTHRPAEPIIISSEISRVPTLSEIDQDDVVSKSFAVQQKVRDTAVQSSSLGIMQEGLRRCVRSERINFYALCYKDTMRYVMALEKSTSREWRLKEDFGYEG